MVGVPHGAAGDWGQPGVAHEGRGAGEPRDRQQLRRQQQAAIGADARDRGQRGAVAWPAPASTIRRSRARMSGVRRSISYRWVVTIARCSTVSRGQAVSWSHARVAWRSNCSRGRLSRCWHWK